MGEKYRAYIQAKNAINAMRVTIDEIGTQHQIASNLVDHLSVTLDRLTPEQEEMILKAIRLVEESMDKVDEVLDESDPRDT